MEKSMNQRRGCQRAIAAVTLSLSLVLSWSAVAQEVSCDDATDFPCRFDTQQVSLNKVPPLFQFQSRLAQAKLPVGEAYFQTVMVKVLSGTNVICMEEIPNVQVEQSVLNLAIGQNMSCELDEVIARYGNLAFQVCLGGPDNCLKPIELGSTPYAIKSSFAVLAQEAPRANIASQANYSVRATADRDLPLRKKISTGYFDFHTHPANRAANIYTPSEYQPYEDGGFIQWTPVKSPGAVRLHIVAKNAATDRLAYLDELVLAAKKTRLPGDLLVDPREDGEGLVVSAVGAHITGNSDFAQSLTVTGQAKLDSQLTVADETEAQGHLTVAANVAVQSGGAAITGDSLVGENLHVMESLEAQAGMNVVDNLAVQGALTVTAMHVTGSLPVQGQASVGSLQSDVVAVHGSPEGGDPLTVGSLAVQNTALVEDDLTVMGNMKVSGPVIFDEHVIFEGGTSSPDDQPDPRYVLSENEARALVFQGEAAFEAGADFGGALDLMGNSMLNFRFQVGEVPPLDCTAEAEGFVYLDSQERSLVVCRTGEWLVMAGGDECGNSNVELSEECDDGNLDEGDGCSLLCEREAGWSCTSAYVQPTTCESVCGDGYVRGDEECDDGNLLAEDGCASDCVPEEGFLCEDEPSVCLSPMGDCEKVWGSHCYWYVTEALPWDEARSWCEEAPVGGYLVSVQTAAENNMIMNMIEATAWIGFNDKAQEGEWGWVEESGELPTYDNWALGEPNNSDGDSHCGAMEIDHAWGIDDGEWNDDACAKAKRYVCERNYGEAGAHCGGVDCPKWEGFDVACNAQDQCEYANANPTGWRQWDVWVWVPSGTFQMGCTSDEYGCSSDEQPQHEVTLADGFFIQKYEAVVAQYEACVAAGICTPANCGSSCYGGWGTNTSANGRAGHPQNGITWQQSSEVCQWLGGRLPTEAEWEYAATGPTHRHYPWGDAPEPGCANGTAVMNDGGYGCGTAGTLPVGTKPEGPAWSGALDMLGNVWEWTADYYHTGYAGAPADGSAWLDPVTDYRCQRGASFDNSGTYMNTSERNSYPATTPRANVGVRCAKSAQ